MLQDLCLVEIVDTVPPEASSQSIGETAESPEDAVGLPRELEDSSDVLMRTLPICENVPSSLSSQKMFHRKAERSSSGASAPAIPDPSALSSFHSTRSPPL